jgi:hypothetical protein
MAWVAIVGGCAVISPAPTEIPIGGLREPITSQDLAAARDGMPGGLLEPGWLPDGFELVNVSYLQAMGDVRSVDLQYRSEVNHLHIWQTTVAPEELGAEDPVKGGGETVAIDDREWTTHDRSANGFANAMQFSARLTDGRTVSIDSDLDPETMRGIIESLYLRAQPTAD